MSEHDNDFREVIDEEEDKNADVVEVTGDTTVDPSVADPNNDKRMIMRTSAISAADRSLLPAR